MGASTSRGEYHGARGSGSAVQDVRSEYADDPIELVQRHSLATSNRFCMLCPKDSGTENRRLYRLSCSAGILWTKIGRFKHKRVFGGC